MDETMAEVADENVGSARLTRSASKKARSPAQSEESGLAAFGAEVIKFDEKVGTQLGAALGADAEEVVENVRVKPDTTKWRKT